MRRDKPHDPLVHFAIVVSMMVVWLFLMAKPTPAQDHDTRWATRRFCAQYAWDGTTCLRYRYEWRRTYAYRAPEPRYHYAAPRYDDEEGSRRGQCRDIKRAVGDQHLTVDGAKKNANDAWAATVRFHIGEKFLDLANARHITYTCSRSSIKEAGSSVTTLGQAFHRCELEAQPCAPAREREER